MFKRRSSSKTQPLSDTPMEQPIEASLSWEASRIHLIEKSEQRAWRVAIVAVICVLLLSVAIALMLPLKQNTPYVIRVDNTTGVPDIITAMDTKGVNFDEVMDKYWLAHYVRARETYDYYTLGHDHNTVMLLSSKSVGEVYNKTFDGDKAPHVIYGNQVRITTDIISVVPDQQGRGTVRFTKTIKRNNDPTSPGIVTRYVATIAYEYRNPSTLLEQDRMVNPFGFQVLSYRVDPELVESVR